MPYLYRTEIKGIQAWILRTGKLKELIGGSNLVEGFEAVVTERIAGLGEVKSAAAGGVWAEFQDQRALSDFASTWILDAWDRYPGATVVQAWVEGSFGDAAARRTVMARAEQQRQIPVRVLPEAGPVTARAGRSGEPAIRRRNAGDRVLEDATMAAQWDAYQEGSHDRLAERLRLGARATPDLESIGERLALVHIDANGMGRRLVEGHVQRLPEFSRALTASTRSAALQALEGEFPCRPIVCGGDDFTVIVPATEALGVVSRYLSEFERATGDAKGNLGGIKGTACAGVALIKPSWPLIDAHHLAETLCAAAKKHCRGQGASNVDPGKSGVCFFRVTTALAASYEEIIGRELTVHDDSDGITRRLTLGHYELGGAEQPGRTIANLERLIAFIRDRKIPRGTLREWLTRVRDDRRDGQWFWARMRETLRAGEDGEKRHAAWDQILRALDCDPATGWGKLMSTDVEGTPVGDALLWLAVARGRSLEATRGN
jgi:hypothetical protein